MLGACTGSDCNPGSADGGAGPPPDGGSSFCTEPVAGLWSGKVLDVTGAAATAWVHLVPRADGARMVAYAYGSTGERVARVATFDPHTLTIPLEIGTASQHRNVTVSIPRCSPGSDATIVATAEGGATTTTSSPWTHTAIAGAQIEERRLVIYPLAAGELPDTLTPARLWSVTDEPRRWSLSVALSSVADADAGTDGTVTGTLASGCAEWGCAADVVDVKGDLGDANISFTIAARAGDPGGSIALAWDATMSSYVGMWTHGGASGWLIAGVEGETQSDDVDAVLTSLAGIADAEEGHGSAAAFVDDEYSSLGFDRAGVLQALKDVAAGSASGTGGGMDGGIDGGPGAGTGATMTIERVSEIHTRVDERLARWTVGIGRANALLAFPDGCRETTQLRLPSRELYTPYGQAMHRDTQLLGPAQPSCTTTHAQLGFAFAWPVRDRTVVLKGNPHPDSGWIGNEAVHVDWFGTSAILPKVTGVCNAGVLRDGIAGVDGGVYGQRFWGLPIDCGSISARTTLHDGDSGVEYGIATLTGTRGDGRTVHTPVISTGPRWGIHTASEAGGHPEGHFGIDFSRVLDPGATYAGTLSQVPIRAPARMALALTQGTGEQHRADAIDLTMLNPSDPLWQPEGELFDVCGAPVVPGDPSKGCYPPVAYPPLDAIHRYLWLSQGVIPPGDRCLLATTAFAAGDTLGAFPTASAGLRTPDGGRLECDQTTDAAAPPPPVTGALGPDPNQGFNVHLESTSSTRITYAAGTATDFTDDYTETHPLDDGGVHYGHLAPPSFAPANFYGSYDADRCPYYDLGYGAAYVLRDHLAAATAQADPAEPMLCNPHWMGGVTLYSLPHFMVHRYRSEIDRTSDSPGRLLSCPPPWAGDAGPNGPPPCGHTMNLLDAEHRDAGVVSYNPGTPADRFSLPIPGDPTSSSWWVPLTDPDPSGSDLDDLMSDEQEPAFEQHIAVGAVGLFNEHDITRGVGQITTVWKRLDPNDNSVPEFIVAAIRVDYIKYSNGGREPFLVPSMTSGSLTADIVHTQYELNLANLTRDQAEQQRHITGVEWKTSPSMALPSHQKRCYWAWFNGTTDPTTRPGPWNRTMGMNAAPIYGGDDSHSGWWWYGRTNEGVAPAADTYQIDSLQSRAGYAYDYSLFNNRESSDPPPALVFLPARGNVMPFGSGALARIFPVRIPREAPVETVEDPRLQIASPPEYQLMADWQADQAVLASQFRCFEAPDEYGQPANDHSDMLAALGLGVRRP